MCENIKNIKNSMNITCKSSKMCNIKTMPKVGSMKVIIFGISLGYSGAIIIFVPQCKVSA